MATLGISEGFDDVGPVTGTLLYGDYTNDTAPVIRVTLGDQAAAGESVSLTDNGAATGVVHVITAADVSAGYVDLQLANLSSDWHPLQATLAASDGTAIATSSIWALGVSTATPDAPTFVTVADDAGTQTGVVADGGRTDDSTLTVTLHEAGLPDPPTGSPGHAPYGGPALMSGTVELFDGSTVIGTAKLSYGGQVTITTSSLSAGDHVLTAVAVDRAGDVSAVSSTFHVTIGADPAPPSNPPPASPPPASSGVAGEQLSADASHPIVMGGAGDDSITGAATVFDYLRGGGGNDSIVGGALFDDINGNAGNDTIDGGSGGGDWLVGGQGDDLITSHSGFAILYGNLGADTLNGGDGGGILRGGQGDDVIVGGAGGDWISGDLGDDTVSGGGGADTFHGSAGAGVDHIGDFDYAQGDRIMLDHGVQYTVGQVGADAVITFQGGGEMVLANVQASNLPSGWIFSL